MTKPTIYGWKLGSPGEGYEITHRDDGKWGWTFHEIDPVNGTTDEDVSSMTFDTKAEALRHAADDWSENGSAGPTGFDSLTRTLRRLATKEESNA